jgi:hypothetical protein
MNLKSNSAGMKHFQLRNTRTYSGAPFVYKLSLK